MREDRGGGSGLTEVRREGFMLGFMESGLLVSREMRAGDILSLTDQTEENLEKEEDGERRGEGVCLYLADAGWTCPG